MRNSDDSSFLLSGAEWDSLRMRVLGFLIKRNIITIFMSIELMLNG